MHHLTQSARAHYAPSDAYECGKQLVPPFFFLLFTHALCMKIRKQCAAADLKLHARIRLGITYLFCGVLFLLYIRLCGSFAALRYSGVVSDDRSMRDKLHGMSAKKVHVDRFVFLWR